MIKGKKILCKTALDDFGIEEVNGMPFYGRFHEFANAFKANGIDDFDDLFAQPECQGSVIEWNIPDADGENPVKLSEISTEEEKAQYLRIAQLTSQRLRDARAKIRKPIDRAFFDCALKHIDDPDRIYCHDGKVIFAAWGLNVKSGHVISDLIVDTITDRRVHHITFAVSGNGQLNGNTEMLRRHNHVINAGEVPEVIPSPRHQLVRWEPCNPQGMSVTTDVDFVAVVEHTDQYEINFVAGDGGKLTGDVPLTAEFKGGTNLFAMPLPIPTPDEGFEFQGWQPAINNQTLVNADQTYRALFSPIEVVPPIPTHMVHFDAGEGGQLPDGFTDPVVEHGNVLTPEQIPVVTPPPGMKFTGWDRTTDGPIDEDTTFRAQYAPVPPVLPWWKRLWLWLTGKGCLKWLLWLLIALLVILLASWLFNRCGGGGLGGGLGCHRDAVVPIDTVTGPDGKPIDDNGRVEPIVVGDDGKLPGDDQIVAPVRGADGNLPPIEERPGQPDVIANRLFLFLEDENGDVDALARDFKNAYPGDQYQIIGFDREVKSLVILVPENERDQIRESLNSKIPNQKFIVFDEEIYEINSTAGESSGNETKGWHLGAIRLKQGWAITKGSPKVRVAVVDDGIDASHAMFQGRIVEPYNVFTQNNHLSRGTGHGTHTASLAAGSAQFFSQGAAGVAPGCQLMPVQVFDNEVCPLSALVSGIMYAVHHKADVINVSIGPSFDGFKGMPEDQQDQIAKTQFRNTEALWKRVTSIAARKRSIIVFAAGNDDLLASIPPENRAQSSIVVTAVDSRRCPTAFTNWGDCADISAPGQGIYAAFPVNSFKSFDGTSMAAPIVAGTVALMKSIKKDLTVEQARIALYNSGANVYGKIPPMVLVDRALQAVKKGDYKKLRPREMPSVPPEDRDHVGNDRGAGASDDGSHASGPGAGSVVAPGDGSSAGGGVVITDPPAAGGGRGGNNYDEIRRQIRDLEQRIRDLRRRLPNGR